MPVLLTLWLAAATAAASGPPPWPESLKCAAHVQAWAEIATKMTRLPQTDPKVRVFIRGMLSQAAEVKLDRQGRANLPRKLLERVGIADRMVVIGALDKIEFWNPEAWGQFMQQADSALEAVAESLEL